MTGVSCKECGTLILSGGLEETILNGWFCDRECIARHKDQIGIHPKCTRCNQPIYLEAHIIEEKTYHLQCRPAPYTIETKQVSATELMQKIEEARPRCTKCHAVIHTEYFMSTQHHPYHMACMYAAPNEEQGVKFDQDKLPYHLISNVAIDDLALRLKHGLDKGYGERNWEKGLSWHRCYRAALGHLYDFWKRKDIDEDSGLSHLSGAFVNLMFLVHYTKHKQYESFDDRPSYK